MFIVKYRKIFFALSGLLIAGSVITLFTLGLNIGTDFKGGSLLEVSYQSTERPPLTEVKQDLDVLTLGNYSVRPSGDRNFIIRTQVITPQQKTEMLSALSNNGDLPVTEERFNSVGPVVGESLKNKSYIAIAVVLFGILSFITIAFRKVSVPVSSWKYGIATIIALFHDIIIPAGIYAIYSQFTGAEVDILFITALLAILGYSVHDTIVVFDRVRENLSINMEYRKEEAFEDVVGRSIYQTIGRSINTSLTTFLPLAVLFLVGSPSTAHFSFLLLIGIIVGTYSSIFVASPLLVFLKNLGRTKSK